MTALQTAQTALMSMIGDVYGDVLTYETIRNDCRTAVLDAYDALRAKYQAAEDTYAAEARHAENNRA